MSEQLLRAIQNVQSEIANHHDVLQNNEDQTISSLVDPILNALGWHTSEIARVRKQFSVRSGRVDMALMRQDRPIVLVEVKALGVPLGDKEIEQIIRYSTDEGAKTALLTNGEEWRVYRPFLLPEKLEFEQRQIFRSRLDSDKAVDSASNLALLHFEKIDELEKHDMKLMLDRYWEANVGKDLLEPFSETLHGSFANWSNIKPTEISIQMVNNLLQEKLGLRRRRVAPQPKPRPTPPPRPRPRANSKPSEVMLDGQRIPISSVYDVLVQTAEWLIQRGFVKHHDCPISTSGARTRYLVHAEPLHPDGKDFFSGKPLSNGLFIEVHASRKQVTSTARRLLELYGYSRDTLQVIGFDD